MQRQDRLFSQRGLLLVEAVLSAVVIAVGLVFISRGLGSQLKALRSLEEYDTLVSLAHGKLLELEGKRFAGGHLSAKDHRGTFEEPYTAYDWTVSAKDGPKDRDGKPLGRALTLTVEHHEGNSTNPHRSASVHLSALWPTDWVPDEWL